jgi:hypothetical protein
VSYQTSRYFSRLDLEIFHKMQKKPSLAMKYFELPLLFANFGGLTVLSFFKDGIHSSLIKAIFQYTKDRIVRE